MSPTPAAILSALSTSEWSIVKSTWCRGWDWWLGHAWKDGKQSRKWKVALPFGLDTAFGTFTTKIAAYDAVNAAIRDESTRRV